MVARKTVCLKHLGGNRGGELGAGRFFANKKVTVTRIIAGWSERTTASVAGRHVLALQDTSEISIATRAGHRRGLGKCGHGNARGILAHVMLAVDADSGACLGLVGGTIWNRDKPVTSPLRKRLLAQRESRRWVETAEAARPVLARAAMVTFVADREGDIYPTWARAPAEGFHVLNRVMSNRCLVGAARGESLFTVAAGFPLAETRVLSLPAHPPRRAAREIGRASCRERVLTGV
jgi:hypothetical protein